MLVLPPRQPAPHPPSRDYLFSWPASRSIASPLSGHTRRPTTNVALQHDNVWVLGDTLYMGAYNAGFRVFDISGELRGDLRAQGREIGHLNTADMDGKVKNSAMTWGVVVNPKDGLA
jgi:hypothetical protein